MKTCETKLEWEAVKKHIPEQTSLIYVDYRDSLDDHQELLQECLSQRDFQPIEDEIFEWYYESEWESLRAYKKELRKDIRKEYDLKKHEAREIIDYYDDEINDCIYERNTDKTLSDLLRNTSLLIAHYDTDFYLDAGSWSWSSAEVRLKRMEVKKHLGIFHTSDYDNAIDMMIAQASGGGQLLIYFKLDLEDFMENSKDKKTIQFYEAMIGIVNHDEGSGDTLDRRIMETISLPFELQNVFLEKSIKWNWTYSIAGMSTDWANSTSITFSDEDTGTIEVSSQNELQKREAEYNAAFKAGGCTFGDMDITRHRNTSYRNDFPCGNKCVECGTFWID